MKHSLKTKLILSYLAVALITILVVSVLIRLNSGQSLMNLVVEEQTATLSDSVKTYYSENGSLTGFSDYYMENNWPEPAGPQPELPDNPPEFRNIRGVQGLIDVNSAALIPTMGFEVGQVVPKEMLRDAVAVEADGETIAFILPDTKFQFQLNTEEEIFLERTTLAISLAAVAGVLVALGMGFFLAGGLIKPIRRLTRASSALAQGNLEQQIPVTSQDELGQLTSTFNQMSADLVRADQQRKRLTADITHDLSTPLQVISGYMEMLEDGSVQLTPQRIEIIKTEIEHLRRLVRDLSTLTQVEAGGLDIQLQPIGAGSLLEKVYNSYQPITEQRGVHLVMDVEDGVPFIRVDEGRMLQVLKNLVENALRYTPRGGEIHLAASLVNPLAGKDEGECRDRSREGMYQFKTCPDLINGKVCLSITDNGEGIDPEDLPYVFERFYQADKSRGANSGKMGLGLAICKALVNAQGGTISAQSAGKGKGTSMVICFEPAEESNNSDLRIDN